MSTYLWKYYLEDDLEGFRQLLATAEYGGSQARPSTAANTGGHVIGSPGRGLATSPVTKSRIKGQSTSAKGGRASSTVTLSRADINSKDRHGVALLHHMASSMSANTPAFAAALIELPLLDLYAQDLESGWTPLHRALYCGNITIARALMDRDVLAFSNSGGGNHAGGLIKIKDKEGNSPFEVYGTTIVTRTIPHSSQGNMLLGENEPDDASSADDTDGSEAEQRWNIHMNGSSAEIDGDEMYTFGSNKNLNLGFGDEDDRQFPERINLNRPPHLLRRLYREHIASFPRDSSSNAERPLNSSSPSALPALVQFKPIKIQDVQLSKLHTAVLTTDPEANLYMCGFGPGGRLGTGDTLTRFNFTSIHGGGLANAKVLSVGLGQNHSLAITANGEVHSWGSNAYGQLGYATASSNPTDESPVQLLPRQIFGALKREVAVACAASSTHSVVSTGASLYTLGKNDGQLGLVDADARLLQVQNTPRKVAASLFSSTIAMISAIDKATICLLENHDVWVFANYGYAKVVFPLGAFSSEFLRNSFLGSRHSCVPNHVVKVCAGGETICALTREGEVLTMNLKVEASATATSTTNPTKIRGALSQPQMTWSLRKSHMAAKDVDVGQDGSVILCTTSGSVWRRVKRAKIKDTKLDPGSSKDYKFSRVPGLTRVVAVRSNAFGAFAAVRRDYDVLRTQVEVTPSTLWEDIFPLLSFRGLSVPLSDVPKPPSNPSAALYDLIGIRRAVLKSADIEVDLMNVLSRTASRDLSTYNIRVGTTVSDIYIPCHDFLLSTRSVTLRKALHTFRESYYFSLPDVFTIEYDKQGKPLILFHGLDVLTLLNLIFYAYTDSIIDVWHFTREKPKMAFRYRQVRTELIKVSAHLEMRSLEHSARLMAEPVKSLHKDFQRTVNDLEFFETGDVEIELEGTSIKVHSALVCQRCPFFNGMFYGRAGGSWLRSRRDLAEESTEAIQVDLKHVSKDTFSLLLRHLYADAGEELFAEIKSADMDTFLDIILDVMAVANELMLDRLAQICQKVLGKFANTRNVCQLLNAVAPCSVTEFKDAALEYICLNLEGMLENGRLGELDEDLMIELDGVVQDNQLACFPIVKSGRAQAELYEHHPELAALTEQARQTKIDYMALQSHLQEEKVRGLRILKSGAAEAKNALPKATSSSTELLFQMDDDADITKSPSQAKLAPKGHEHESWPSPSPQSSFASDGVWLNHRGKAEGHEVHSPNWNVGSGLGMTNLESPEGICGEVSSSQSKNTQPTGEVEFSSPWRNASLSTSRLNMKEIIAQASEKRLSNISTAISQTSGSSPVTTTGRLSQKERKRQQQQLQLQQQSRSVNTSSPSTSMATTSHESMSSPWQVPSNGPKISLKDVLQSRNERSPSPATSEIRPSPSPALTLRQTVPGNLATARKTSSGQISSQAPPITQQRSVSYPAASPANQSSPKQRPKLSTAATSNSQITPRSIRHTSTPVEPSLQLSMADILAQQQTEKDIIKEAVAKRSLQEIQEEQAFQEWWDQEEAAMRARMEEEAAAAVKATPDSGGRGGGRGGKRRGRGRDGRQARSSGKEDKDKKEGGIGQGEIIPRPSRGRGRGKRQAG